MTRADAARPEPSGPHRKRRRPLCPFLCGAAMPPKREAVALEAISKHFHLPMSDAAKAMGVCQSVLKRWCRQYGTFVQFSTTKTPP